MLVQESVCSFSFARAFDKANAKALSRDAADAAYQKVAAASANAPPPPPLNMLEANPADVAFQVGRQFLSFPVLSFWKLSVDSPCLPPVV
jgi:hypothetical protein